MSDSEDTVFVECDNGVAKYDREPSVEILHHNSDVGVVAEEVNTGEREDIVQVITQKECIIKFVSLKYKVHNSYH